MTEKIRTVLFFVCCFLFLLIGIPLILYSQGYAFDFEKKRVVQTGGLFVETKQGDIKIYLSGKLKGETGTILKYAFIKNLIPRFYQIELRKSGCNTWEKNLEIKEKLTTEIKNVILLPKELRKEMVLDKNIQSFFVSPDEKQIANITLDNKLEILNLKSGETSTILAANKINKILWESNSQKILFSAKSGQKTSWFVYNLKWSAPESLDRFIGAYQKIGELKWHSKDSTQIYFLGKGLKKEGFVLYKIDLLNGKVSIILESVKSYEISIDGIYWLDEISGLLFKTDFDGKSRQQLAFSPPPDYSAENDYKIFISVPKIGLMENENNFYFFDPKSKNFEKITNNIKTAKLSEDSKKLLYFGPNEIWVLYSEDVLIQPFKYKGDKELIGRFAQDVKEVLWYPDSEHLIFLVGDTIKFTELDGRDVRNTIDVLEAKNSQIYYRKASKELYLLDEGKLYSVKL